VPAPASNSIPNPLNQPGLVPVQAAAAVAANGSALGRVGLVLSQRTAQQLVPRPLWGLLNERNRPWHRQVRMESSQAVLGV
jgi:hypothetical protein